MLVKCERLMRRNKMLIYIKKENIFFDNVNCCESIYDFFYAHQNYKKKIGYKIYLQRRV